MGVAKTTRKFAVSPILRIPCHFPVPRGQVLTRCAQQQTKRVIGKRDDRLKENREKADKVQEARKKATANGELSMPFFFSSPSCPSPPPSTSPPPPPGTRRRPRPLLRLRPYADHRHLHSPRDPPGAIFLVLPTQYGSRVSKIPGPHRLCSGTLQKATIWQSSDS